MGSVKKLWMLWIGVAVLLSWTVVFYFIGRAVWGDEVFDPNYAASMAGAGLGGALSLLVVIISFAITERSRQKDLSYARFAFLRRKGERLWQAYVAFCQSLGVATATMGGATWNSTDRGLWPDRSRALELDKLLKGQTAKFTSSAPGESALDLMDAYDDVFMAVSETVIFEGQHLTARDITEAARQFGWACTRIQDYQSRIGWTAQDWPEISKAVQQTSELVSKTISSLGELAATIRIK